MNAKPTAADAARQDSDLTAIEDGCDDAMPPKGECDEEEYVEWLADLGPLELARELPRAAKRLQAKEIVVKNEVNHRKKKRAKGSGNSNGDSKPGRPDIFQEPEPWPEPVDLGSLLEQTATELSRFIVLPPDANAVIALWIAFTHVFDSFDHYPYLCVHAPEPNCGKTTLLDLVRLLIAKPLKTDGITAAPLFRLIEQHRPSIVLDEVDAYIHGNEGMRNVLDSGHNKDGRVHRCVGDDHETRGFSTGCPKAFGLIGNLPRTVASRSIKVKLKRALRSEKPEKFRASDPHCFEDLKRQFIRWAADHAGELRGARPDMGELNNRQADNWEPLYAIADMAEGAWPDIVRGAAEILESASVDVSYRVELLLDIRRYFDEKGADTVSTKDLVDYLNDLEGSRWSEFGNNGRGITAHAMAKILKSFDIEPGRPGRIQRGYSRTQFEDAWSRYCAEK